MADGMTTTSEARSPEQQAAHPASPVTPLWQDLLTERKVLRALEASADEGPTTRSAIPPLMPAQLASAFPLFSSAVTGTSPAVSANPPAESPEGTPAMGSECRENV